MKNKIIYWSAMIVGSSACLLSSNWQIGWAWVFSLLAYISGVAAGVFGSESFKEKSS